MMAIASQTSNLSASVTLPVINDALQLLDNSPIPRKKLKKVNNTWIPQKIKTMAYSLERSLGVDTSVLTGDAKNFGEMLTQLKIKYHQFGTSRDIKIQMLTILPKSWNISEIVSAMNCTRYMAKMTKKLVDEGGILSTPIKKRGKFQKLLNDIFLFSCSVFLIITLIACSKARLYRRMSCQRSFVSTRTTR